MKQKYDLAIVLPHFESGGAQKVAQILLTEFTKAGKKCALIIIFDNNQDKYHIPSNVDRYDIFSKNDYHTSQLISFTFLPKWLVNIFRLPFRVINALKIILRLKATLQDINAATVLSFLTVANILTILASITQKWKLVISERNDISKQKNVFPISQLRTLLYNKADVVTANTQHSLECMKPYVNLQKLLYVPNPINRLACINHSKDRKGFLFVGRLVPQKSVHTLMEAFNIARPQLSGWSLDLVGDGPELDNLRKIVQKYHLENEVFFHGYQSAIAKYYEKNAIFVLPSLYEGLPNVLLEAMMFSMPAIVSDSCPGAVELTDNGACGLSFPSENYEMLAAQMITLAKNQQKILDMGNNSRLKVEAFETSNVLNIWRSLLLES